GAIGGIWRELISLLRLSLSLSTRCFSEFVVIAFGLFFVFSEKQLPDKKIRNFK
ncbi:unnamed protein product, partial [Ectocarpus sp. 13 AM-2016]